MVLRFLTMLVLWPLTTGFVFLGSIESRLPVTPESPEVTFVWSGETPEIEDKEDYQSGIYQDLSDEDFFAQLLQDAMDVWNNVPGSYVVMSLAEGEAVTDETDLQNSIVIDSVNATSAAFALPVTNEDNPEILEDCDITISSKKTGARELAYTIAHELGHCLGLGHSHSNYAAMMGYSRNAYTLKLGADDMAGVMYLYPDPAYIPNEAEELIACGTLRAAEGTGLWLLLALVLPLCVPATASLRAIRRIPLADRPLG